MMKNLPFTCRQLWPDRLCELKLLNAVAFDFKATPNHLGSGWQMFGGPIIYCCLRAF